MKTIFDTTTRNALISRINTLNGDSTAQWGKMNVYQMLKHCTLFDEMVQGKMVFKRAPIGYLFGKLALKSFIGDDGPVKRDLPTLPGLLVTATHGDVEAQKKQWIAQVEAYADYTNDGFTHSFFGKLNRGQAGQLAYKHIDHHLRQFNS